MKKIFLAFSIFHLLFFTILLPSRASAHMVGQPPFFKVNGAYTDYYPVPTTSLNDFDLPQDIAAPVLVGEEVTFEIDRNQLPVLPDVIDQTKFLWDFGDGEKSVGLNNKHSYKKIGSYTLKIDAQYRDDEPQLIQSTRINVVADKNFKLPQAKILINGRESKDPLTDIINVDYSKEVKFDSSKSETSSKIVSYRWDFGDGKSSNEANPTYLYDKEWPQLFPVLRVVDENGFIADAYVEIDNKPESGAAIGGFKFSSGAGFNFIYIPIIVVGILLVGGIGFLLFKSKR